VIVAVIIPEEDELRSRILAHLEARPGNPFVAAVWSGYISSLLEWGVIDANVHSRLVGLLPQAGRMEVIEILAGLDYVDAHPELREEIRPAQTQRATA
jgi:hypothetical protein